MPIEILEKGKSAMLQKVTIHNFPVADIHRPKSWLLNLETTEPLFKTASKTTENALLLFTYDRLVVFMIEMKSSLYRIRLDHIEEKIKETMGRVATFLPFYIFDATYESIKIEYKSLVFYNHDNTGLMEELEKTDLYKILKGEKINHRKQKDNHLYLENILVGEKRVEVFFFENHDKGANSMSFDFETAFLEEEYQFCAEYCDFTLPEI